MPAKFVLGHIRQQLEIFKWPTCIPPRQALNELIRKKLKIEQHFLEQAKVSAAKEKYVTTKRTAINRSWFSNGTVAQKNGIQWGAMTLFLPSRCPLLARPVAKLRHRPHTQTHDSKIALGNGGVCHQPGGSFFVRTTFDWEASVAHILCKGLTFSRPIVVIDWCMTACVAACVKRPLRRDKPSYCLAALMLAGALR